MSVQQNDQIADAYAEALVDLAEERGELEAVANDVDGLRKVIDDDPQFGRFIRDLGIGSEDREKVLTSTFGDGKVNGTLLNVMQVMNKKDRLAKLPQMLEAFERLMDRKLGKVEVDVTVATELTSGQLDEVKDRVSRALGKDAVVHQYVDESILGGMVLRVGDKIIDTSVRKQLDQLKQRLMAAK